MTDEIETIVKLASDLAAPVEGVFDERLGASPVCLSASQMLRFVEGGATLEELEHTLTCSDCRKIAAAVLNFQEDGEFVDSLFDNTAWERPEPVRTKSFVVLATKSRQFTVADPAAKDLTFECYVMAAAGAKPPEKESLRLDGAYKSHHCLRLESVDFDHDGRIDYWRVIFDRGSLSRRVKSHLNRQQRIIDTLQISGSTEDKLALVGLTRLEFVGDLGGLRPLTP